MPHFFERRDIFGNSPAVWVFAAILFALPLGTWSLSGLQRHDNAGMWLVPEDALRQQHEWAAETFPIEHDLLVTWTGSSLNDPRVADFRRCLEPKRDDHGVLRGGKPQIARIDDPRDTFQQMLASDVPAKEALQRLTGIQIGTGPLCVRLTDEGRKRLRRIQSELPVIAHKQWGMTLRVTAPNAVTATAGDDAANMEPIALTADGVLLESTDTSHDLCIVAEGIPGRQLAEKLKAFHLEGVADSTALIADQFYLPGHPVALSVTFSDAGRADRAETLHIIRTAAADVGIPASDLRILGPAMMEADLQAVAQAAVWTPSARWQQVARRSALLTSIIAAVLLTVLLLRDVRMITVSLLCAGGTLFGTMALMPVAGAEFSIWQFTTPVWLGAFALAAAISVARQRQLAPGLPAAAVQTALQRTSGTTLATCGLLLVSVVGWCASPLSPVRDWGEVASVSVIMAGALVLVGVPSLMLLWPGRTANIPHDSTLWHAMGNAWSRHPAWQSMGTLAVIVTAAFGLRHPHLQLDLLHSLPQTSSARIAATEMESQLTGTVLAESVIRFDARAQDERDALARMELVREVETQLRLHPAVTGCLSWADFSPVSEPLAEDASRLEVNRRAKRAQAQQEEWRDGQTFAHAANFYTVATKDRDAVIDGDHGYCQRGDELWRISTRVRGAGSTSLAQTQRELDNILRGVLKAAPGTRHQMVGPLMVQLQTERLMLRSFLIATVVGLGILALLAMVTLRHFGAGFLAVIGSAAPLAAVIGGWSWSGGALDLTAMLATTIALGLSAGQIVPLLVAFQVARKRGCNRNEAVCAMLSEQGPGACRMAWIMGLTVWPLSTSSTGAIGHFGQLLPLMIAAGAVAQMMWLPQLLAGPIGLMFAQGPHVETEPKAAEDLPIARPWAA